MKKLLLTLTSAVALAFAANAAEPVVVDFTTQEGFKGVAEGKTVTVDGIDFKFENANAYISKYGEEPAYVMIKSNNGAVSFSLSFDCAKMVIHTTGGNYGNSTSADNKLALKVGETEVMSQPVNQRDADFTFSTGTHTAAGTVYTLASAGSKNSQFTTLTLYPVTNEASISIDDKLLSFATGLNGEQTLSFKVNCSNITDAITVTSSNPAFTPVKASVTADEAAEGIEILFKGTSTEILEGSVTVSANGTSAEIDVEGFAVAHAGTESDPLTVSDVLAMNNANDGTFYIKGTVGEFCAANAKDGMVTEVADASKNVKTNIILKEGDKMIGVALPVGETRDMLNIVDNPSVAGKTIVISGSLEAYFSAPGVKNAVYVSGLDESGIDNITTDSNAPAEYYNLQGVRVANPEAGLYIRRQGNNVTKVYVK